MVAKYPVEPSDQEGIVDAVNYLLSGPAGLGQNFDGFSAYTPAYLRLSNRQPWSLPITSGLNSSVNLAIPISNIVPLGGNPSSFLTVTFATPQATAPFQFGDRLDIAGVVETGSDEPLNSTSDAVFSCTTTEVVVGYNGDFPSLTWNTYVSGGTIGRDYLNTILETDCNARITIQGPTDQAFINGQINLEWTYTCSVATTYNVKVRIGRLRGFPSDTPGSNDFLFADEVLVTEKNNYRTVTVGSGTDTLETIFTSVLDGPNLDFGYYWYILEVYFEVEGSLPDDSDTFITTGTKAALGSTTIYSGISPTTVTGVGTGAVIDVELDASAAGIPYLINTNTYTTVTTAGQDYKVGDILTIPGTSLGGASPANDLTLTVDLVIAPYNVEIGPVTMGLRSLTAQAVKE
jgi:hypothetical protein